MRRCVVQRLIEHAGSDRWMDCFGGNDIEGGQKVITDFRKRYPDVTFRLIIIIDETSGVSYIFPVDEPTQQ